MKPALPFAILGAAALLGALTLERADAKSFLSPSHDGSVKVTADLEQTKLLAGQTGETFARIILTGKDAPRKTERVPVSLTLIIDVSGSMAGDKIENAKAAASAALDQLLPGDVACVVAFSSSAELVVPRVEVGRDSIEQARAKIAALHSGGGTNMRHALDTGRTAAESLFGQTRTNRVLLLSDGRPDSARGLVEQVAEMSRRNILTTTIGIGRDYNEDLMAKLADAGLANYYFVEYASQMAQIFATELKDIGAVVAKEAVVTIALKDGVEVLDVYGYRFSRGERVVAIPVGDIYAQKSADILAKLRVPARAGKSELVEVKVSYHDALQNTARRVSRPLLAEFVTDEATALASYVPAVRAKTQAVRTAETLEKASAAFARGDRIGGRQMIAAQAASNAAFSGSAKVKGSSYADDAKKMNEVLDGLAQEAEAPAVDFNVMQKKAKRRARLYKRGSKLAK